MRYVLIATIIWFAACSSLSDDRQAITQALHQSIDKPGAQLEVDPIVVRQSYAIAGWLQGEAGGRALLHRERGEWKIVAQAGEELRDAQFVKAAGVPQQEASALTNMLITAERSVPEARLARFDRYGENVRR
jgi:hypothetical protein